MQQHRWVALLAMSLAACSGGQGSGGSGGDSGGAGGSAAGSGGTGGSGGTVIDVDEDGFSPPEDCDDDDELVNPDAAEIYGNGQDDDCAEATLDDPGGAAGPDDLDGDSFEADQAVGSDGDCDDTDPTVFDDAPEIAEDGIDNDCDGSDLSEATAGTVNVFYVDAASAAGAPDGTRAAPFPDLQAAIDLANDGAIVFVAEGMYGRVVNGGVTVSLHGGYQIDGTTWTRPVDHRGLSVIQSPIQDTGLEISGGAVTLDGVDVRGPTGLVANGIRVTDGTLRMAGGEVIGDGAELADGLILDGGTAFLVEVTLTGSYRAVEAFNGTGAAFLYAHGSVLGGPVDESSASSVAIDVMGDGSGRLVANLILTSSGACYARDNAQLVLLGNHLRVVANPDNARMLLTENGGTAFAANNLFDFSAAVTVPRFDVAIASASMWLVNNTARMGTASYRVFAADDTAGSELHLINNLFASDDVDDTVAFEHSAGGTFELRNNLLVYADVLMSIGITDITDIVELNAGAWAGAIAGKVSGNAVDTNPGINPTGHLSASSPAQGQGLDLSAADDVPTLLLTALRFDRDGDLRPSGEAWDIGADED